MKPYKILLFFIAVFVILSVVIVAIPEDGIKITENFTITFPTFKDIFNPDKIEYADISDIINGDADSSINTRDSLNVDETIPLDAKTLRKKLSKLQYPNDNKTVLYPFFEELDRISTQKELIWIIHYGDSQIEGDRFSAYIRNNLQKMFGGTGIGLIQVVEISPRFTIDHSATANWTRYTGFGRKDTNVLHKRYGALISFCRFAPINNDSILNDSIEYTSSVTFKQARSGYYRNKKYDQLRMFYGYNKQAVMVEMYLNEELISSDTLKPNTELMVKTWKIDQDPEEIIIKFKGKDSPDIYGFAMDSYQGIAVDNVAMRGCSGTVFSKLDLAHLQQMYNSLNVKLLIMQFGGNVMPYIKTEKDCKNYGNWFRSQLYTLKRIKPDLNIIVIGLADMSVKEKGKFVTYPLLEEVRNSLKDASFEAGCPYWDMYEAMGGKNSMPGWVASEPPLAAKDYAHFSSRGASILAEIFYNSFIKDYYEYKKRNKKQL